MTFSQRIGPGAGMFGSVVLAFLSAVAALVYTGTQGEGFSPLNHWISELGEMSVSEMGFLFNVGIFVSGICLAIFMTTLGVTRRTRLAWLYVPVGILSGVGGAFVGVFPMDSGGPHV